MRKTLQIVPVLLLFAAIGAPRAHAQTIEESPTGTVTGIDNLTILGTTYDVTFVFTDSPTITFTDSADSTTSAEDIDAAINEHASFPNTLDGYYYAYVPYAVSSPFFETEGISCDPATNPCATSYDLAPGSPIYVGEHDENPFAEFEPTSVTPEPRTSVLFVSGIGLIAFTLLIEKRRARGLLQCT